MTIKAINTRYKGYRFRSRLEARWAVFFDSLGLKWEYEPEGFELGEAGWYLPDFYLPELNCWAEVKPHINSKQICINDLNKFGSFCVGLKTTLLILDGIPEPRVYYCVLVQGNEVINNYPFSWNVKYLPPINHDGKPRLYWHPGCDEEAEEHSPYFAIQAARSARFEHGEVPAL